MLLFPLLLRMQQTAWPSILLQCCLSLHLLLMPSPSVAGSDADSLARTPSSLGDATLDGLGSEGTNGSEATPRVSDGGEGAAS